MKAKSYFNKFWAELVKNRCVRLGHETLKSAVFQDWIGDLICFLHAGSDTIIFGLTVNLALYQWLLKAGGSTAAVYCIVRVYIRKIWNICFWKIWCALFSCCLHFEIHPFSLLPLNFIPSSWITFKIAAASPLTHSFPMHPFSIP